MPSSRHACPWLAGPLAGLLQGSLLQPGQARHRAPSLPPTAPQELHAHLQPLLYFFVDGASTIDAADPGWQLFTAVEAAPDGQACVLGFATVYRCAARRLLGLTLVPPPLLLCLPGAAPCRCLPHCSGRSSCLIAPSCYCARHYHYPTGARLKLCQILVLPPHQGRGAGAMLLGAAQALADELGACDLSARVWGALCAGGGCCWVLPLL